VRNSVSPSGGEHVAILVEGEGEDSRGVSLTACDVLLFTNVPEPDKALVHTSGQNQAIRVELRAGESICGIATADSLLGQTGPAREVVEAPAGILRDRDDVGIWVCVRG
jgi:hypothetical protein